jgi:tetratricopeptide (TPR) repeat protein
MLQTLRIVVAATVGLLALGLVAGAGAEPPAELISRGEALLAEKNIDGAIATLTEAVAAHPESALAHARLGGAYLLAGRYTEAIDQFQQAVGIDPESAGAFIGLGMAYLHRGNTDLATAAFTEAKRLDPTKAAQLADLIRQIHDGAGDATGGHQ